MNMEEVAGIQESYGLGRDWSKELRPSSCEEMLPRLLWKLFLRNAAILAQHEGEWIILYIIIFF